MLDDRVTRDFALSEFVVSDTATRLGIDNMPPAQIEATLRNVLIPAMQGLRDALGVPIAIKSGYRSAELNAAVRGSQSSQHCTGHAADFVAPQFGSPLTVARFITARIKELLIDQVIAEGGWVHVSFAPHPRYEALTAHFTSAGVNYTRGIA